MKLTDSVILPREDFIELETAAWSHTPTSVKERIGTTVQTTLFFTAATAAFSCGTWVWYKLMSKLENEKLANKITEMEEQKKLNNSK